MRILLIPLAMVVLFAGAPGASAQQQMSTIEIRDYIQKLKSPNPEEVRLSITKLATSGSTKAVVPLTDLLRSGPRNDITNAIIQALGTLGSKNSISVLLEYLDHRRPDARREALAAIRNFKDPRVIPAIEGKLRDSDPIVRNDAAIALGELGSVKSINILFQAFDRGVFDAVIAIGEVGTLADAERLAGYLGKVDVAILLPGFEQFLKRNSIPDDAKIKILENLKELAGPEVKKFAVAYQATFPPGTDEDENPLYKTVCRMVREIRD